MKELLKEVSKSISGSAIAEKYSGCRTSADGSSPTKYKTSSAQGDIMIVSALTAGSSRGAVCFGVGASKEEYYWEERLIGKRRLIGQMRDGATQIQGESESAEKALRDGMKRLMMTL